MGKREYNKGRQKCATIKATKATKKRWQKKGNESCHKKGAK